MASNHGNSERFKCLLYSGYKKSLERGIARLLNETSGLQESNLAISVTAMKVNEFITLT